jgi:fatty-acyl-CoA synthase
MSIAGWITQWADTDRVAFHFEGHPTTYVELALRADRTAAALASSGVGVGDRVGFCGLNRLELFDALFASAKLGAIFMPFNNRLTAAELSVQIVDSSPSVLLATDGFHELLGDAAPGLAVRDLDASPFDNESLLEGTIVDHDDPEAIVLMVYTSGTTGHPKGAMLSHRAVLHTVLNSIDHQQLTADDCIVAPLPTFHVGGLNIQTLPTLYVGGQVLLQRRFDPANVLDLIAEYRPTQTLLVPAMLSAIAAHPHFTDIDLSCLRGINSGSSVVPADVMQPFFDRGVPVGQVYGTTETGPTAVVLRYDDAAAQVGSCGRPALHTDLRIVDIRGNDVPDGQPGELWLRGLNLFSGYWNKAEATREAFADGDWFRTGDVGYRNPDGYVIISDRIKDVVISGGENIYPAELEPVLSQHEAIVEVAVVGDANERWGEIPVAVVVLADGYTLDIDELRTWCTGRVARFKQPRALRIVDELPRTALGKVKKHELRSQTRH